VLLRLRLWWCPKLNIVHLLLASGTAHLRRRTRLRLVFTRGTRFLYERILLGRVVPTFRHLTDRARIATSLVTRLIVVLILPSRTLRETSVGARVHYTTIEEIPTGEVVTTGKFLVNDHPIVVLFDLGVSHSFASSSFASKHNLNVITIAKGGYCISAAGNNISTNQVVNNVRVEIGDREFLVDLVVLPGPGIDVILRMKWMSGLGC
jgi:hypothetical protein